MSARTDELSGLTLVEAANAVKNGDATSVDLVQAALAAFDKGDKAVNSVITLDREAALSAAEGLDKLRKAGRALGPLHGVPLAHKDMYYRAGQPCTGGSKIR